MITWLLNKIQLKFKNNKKERLCKKTERLLWTWVSDTRRSYVRARMNINIHLYVSMQRHDTPVDMRVWCVSRVIIPPWDMSESVTKNPESDLRNSQIFRPILLDGFVIIFIFLILDKLFWIVDINEVIGLIFMI